MPNTEKSTKKLLSITNLKKYFPVAKSSVFQKQQLYVKANEDITLDIYEGETLGIVGESGCGKSTLGRVLLQLYEQTAGTTMYYGIPRARLAPRYVTDTLRHADRYIKKVKTAEARARAAEEKVQSLGDAATFFDLQSLNLANAEYQTALAHVAKIMGGFLARDTEAGTRLLLEKARAEEAMALLNDKLRDLELSLEEAETPAEDGKPVKASQRARLTRQIAALEIKRKTLETTIAGLEPQIEALRARYADDPVFQQYEAMLDDGIDLARLTYNEMRLLRKDLQIVFQDPYSSLNPRMTIGQIIEEGLVTHKFYRHGSPKMKEHILNVMRQCGLQDYMLHRYPHQFSGGQRQRVAIARALAVHPKFVVCDECVSALDVSIQSQIINLLQELKEKEHLTYMFISHDLSVVRYISDRICVMYLGNIVELADAATIFDDPRHPYTVALLSSIPTTDMDSLSKERILLEGNIPSPIKPPDGCKFHTRCWMACDKCRRVPPPLTEIEPGHFVACHFPERKLDANGNYLFELPKTERKSMKTADVAADTATDTPADTVEASE